MYQYLQQLQIYVCTKKIRKFTKKIRKPTKKIRKSKFCSRIFLVVLDCSQVLRTFTTERSYCFGCNHPLSPPPEIFFFIGAEESWVREGLPKIQKLVPKKSGKHTKKIRKTYQKNPETIPKKSGNHTKKIRKYGTCWAVQEQFRTVLRSRPTSSRSVRGGSRRSCALRRCASPHHGICLARAACGARLPLGQGCPGRDGGVIEVGRGLRNNRNKALAIHRHSRHRW